MKLEVEKVYTNDSMRNAKDKNVVDSFLLLLSHEIRTPLNAIVSGVDLLNSEIKIQNNENMMIIDYGVTRLMSIMYILSDIAHLRSNNFQKTSAIVDVKMLISKLEHELNIFSEIEGIPKIVLQYSFDGLSQLVFDEGIVFKILNILCGNIQAIDKNSKIKISFCSKNNKEIVITVHETGNGISIDKIPSIHDPISITNTCSHNLYVANRVIYHVYMNELLKNTDTKIEIITNNPKAVYFQISVPIQYN